jgi:hypothetical protein
LGGLPKGFEIVFHRLTQTSRGWTFFVLKGFQLLYGFTAAGAAFTCFRRLYSLVALFFHVFKK